MLRKLNGKVEDVLETVFCDYFPITFVIAILLIAGIYLLAAK